MLGGRAGAPRPGLRTLLPRRRSSLRTAPTHCRALGRASQPPCSRWVVRTTASSSANPTSCRAVRLSECCRRDQNCSASCRAVTELGSRAVSRAECIVRVPARCLLRVAVGLEDLQYGKAVHALRDESGPELDTRYLLCLVLLLERAKGPASAWAPYINALPATYSEPRVTQQSRAPVSSGFMVDEDLFSWNMEIWLV